MLFTILFGCSCSRIMDSVGPRFCLLSRIITGGDDVVDDEIFFSSISHVFFVLYFFKLKMNFKLILK